MQNNYPWHKKQWSLFQKMVTANRLSHALLLIGQEGIGKYDYATSVGQHLVCEHRNACGKCQFCHWFSVGSHPDVLRIQDETIKVDQIRQASRFLQKSAQYTSHKVLIIDHAERMNQSSSNALLKSLEEPIANALIILTVKQVDLLLPTVVSRCQKMFFDKPETQQALTWLCSNTNSDSCEQALEYANGAPLNAIKLLQNDLLATYQSWLKDLVKLARGQVLPTKVSEGWAKSNEPGLIDFLLCWTVDLLKFRSGADEAMLSFSSLSHVYQKYWGSFSSQALSDFYNNLLRYKSAITKSVALNQQLMFDQALSSLVLLNCDRAI